MFCRVATLPSSLLPTGFTAITDHPSGGEVLPGRGPQCGAAPIKFRTVSGPGPRRVRGEAGSQSAKLFIRFAFYINRWLHSYEIHTRFSFLLTCIENTCKI
jgi:hypothetical protein